MADPGAPRAERSGLIYTCPVQPGTCDGVRGDTSRYLDVPHARDNNPCVDGLTLRNFPQSYIEGRLFDQARKPFYTVGRVLIVQLNNCILVKSGQIANPIYIITMDEPVPYCSIRARFMFVNLLIAKRRKIRNSQLIDTRN